MAPSTASIVTAALGTIAVVVAAGPGLWTAITHRDSDNGLSFGLLTVGVAVWNGTTILQVLAQEVAVQTYFLGLSLVGTAMTGLGWVLFASTAHSTPRHLERRSVYVLAALAVGLHSGIAVTAPIHELYWSGIADAIAAYGVTTVIATTGYWVQLAAMIGLFGVGSWLFALPPQRSTERRYSMAYTGCGIAVALTLLVSSAMAPGAGVLAPLVATGLVVIGVVQAARPV